jgi:hypothetical protein
MATSMRRLSAAGCLLDACQLGIVEPNQMTMMARIDDRSTRSIVRMDVHSLVAIRTIDHFLQRLRIKNQWDHLGTAVLGASFPSNFRENGSFHENSAAPGTKARATSVNRRLHEFRLATGAIDSGRMIQRNDSISAFCIGFQIAGRRTIATRQDCAAFAKFERGSAIQAIHRTFFLCHDGIGGEFDRYRKCSSRKQAHSEDACEESISLDRATFFV